MDYSDYYNNQTYYDVLGVSEDASLESIRSARDRAYYGSPGHPEDRLSPYMWPTVDKAYSVLSNPEKRREYDASLEKARSGYSSYGSEPEQELPALSTPELESEQELPALSTPELESEQELPALPTPELEQHIDELPDQDLEDDIEEKENEDIQNTSQYMTLFKDPVKKPNVVSKKVTPLLKKVGSSVPYIGGGILTVVCTPLAPVIAFSVGVIATLNIARLLKPIFKKIKLIKDKKVKKVTKIITPEMKAEQEYKQTLDKEFNRLLSEPHNNYQLTLLKAKYENQIELLKKKLEMKMNTKNKKGIGYKLDIISIKMQLNDLNENLSKVIDKIEKYEGKQRLTRLNEKLMEANKEFVEYRDTKKQRKYQIKQSRALARRDKNASRVKFVVVKSQAVYDKFKKGIDFAKSFRYVFKSSDEVDNFVPEEVAKKSR